MLLERLIFIFYTIFTKSFLNLKGASIIEAGDITFINNVCTDEYLVLFCMVEGK